MKPDFQRPSDKQVIIDIMRFLFYKEIEIPGKDFVFGASYKPRYKFSYQKLFNIIIVIVLLNFMMACGILLKISS